MSDNTTTHVIQTNGSRRPGQPAASTDEGISWRELAQQYDGTWAIGWLYKTYVHMAHWRTPNYDAFPPDERAEFAELRAQGKSTRQIAAVVGVDARTVRRDIEAGGADAPPVAQPEKEKATDDRQADRGGSADREGGPDYFLPPVGRGGSGGVSGGRK